MKTQPHTLGIACAGCSGVNVANAGFGPGSSCVLNTSLLSWT